MVRVAEWLIRCGQARHDQRSSGGLCHPNLERRETTHRGTCEIPGPVSPHFTYPPTHTHTGLSARLGFVSGRDLSADR
ncbi:hypothetical protein RRG08_027931 [Elysia crispata]|uniref:Uncharacterized protein n=1 Tax=Elysia crispata TaxID=231223 RepID=A0AAE1CU16_9GAST|nr:hypothetical protein RRG08_027931 [Elysia crispata]